MRHHKQNEVKTTNPVMQKPKLSVMNQNAAKQIKIIMKTQNDGLEMKISGNKN